jgi:hypothetical protein
MPLGNVLQTLIMLAAVSVGSVFVGSLFRRFNQPAVVGVILFGIVVGTILTASSHSIKSVLLSGTTKSLVGQPVGARRAKLHLQRSRLATTPGRSRLNCSLAQGDRRNAPM